MRIDGVQIETIHDPSRYTYAQISRAYAIARMLGRGKLVSWKRSGDERRAAARPSDSQRSRRLLL